MEVELGDGVNPPQPPVQQLLDRFKLTSPLSICALFCLLASVSISAVVQKLITSSSWSYVFVGGVGIVFLVFIGFFVHYSTEERIRSMTHEIAFYVLCFTSFYNMGLDSLPSGLGSIIPILCTYVSINGLIFVVHRQGRKHRLPEYAAALNAILVGVGYSVLQKLPTDAAAYPLLAKYGVVCLGVLGSGLTVRLLDISDLPPPGPVQQLLRNFPVAPPMMNNNL